MTEFTFITANDIHISDNGPRSRTDDFKSTVLGKIGQIRMASSKLNADGVLIAGDLFNLKTPSKNSHSLTQELIREFRQFKCPIYMIEGNHDLTANRLESLDSQPLGVLFADGTLIQLRNTTIKKNGFEVSLVGIPYTEKIDLSESKVPDKGISVCQICLLHLYASPTPNMLFKEKIYGYKEISSYINSDIFVIGHYHIDQGITEENGKYFINIGSLTRGTLSEEDISHHPKMGFIRISVDESSKVTYNVQAIKLKIKPSDEIFDLKKRDEEILRINAMESFVNKLVIDSSEINSHDYNKILNNMDIVDEVRKKALYFLQEASHK